MPRAVYLVMTTDPSIVTRAEQPYVGVRSAVTMETISTIADRIPEVFGWLASHGVAPAGPPFLRYRMIDMDRRLDIEAGVPVAAATGDDQVHLDVLPAGRYVTLTHVGHFDGLAATTGELLAWAAGEGLTWDMTETPDGQAWNCRLEIYVTNPAEQPDPATWETQLAFRLAD